MRNQREVTLARSQLATLVTNVTAAPGQASVFPDLATEDLRTSVAVASSVSYYCQTTLAKRIEAQGGKLDGTRPPAPRSHPLGLPPIPVRIEALQADDLVPAPSPDGLAADFPELSAAEFTQLLDGMNHCLDGVTKASTGSTAARSAIRS